ncbi:MAG: HAD family phosphatase [Patescibacteria group bacterium]|nr:HAD family phosphatase [Patescibacteria group bacterium]
MDKKLAVFDIDGTIAVKGKIPQEVIEGLRHIQKIGYLTTVSTGRGYRRLRDALGNDFDTVVSQDALIVVEHGTKIVHRDGRIVQADYFGPAEVDHVVDFLHANAPMIVHLAFATPDPEAPNQIWVKEGEDVEAIRKKREHYAEVFQCSYEELKERMHTFQISHVLAKLQDFITVENLKLHFTRSNLDAIFMDSYIQFVGSFSDKAKAILYLEKFHEITVKNMLFAGNGINDVDMLNLEAGKRILVGTDEQAGNVLGHLKASEDIIRMDSPQELGVYLQEVGD